MEIILNLSLSLIVFGVALLYHKITYKKMVKKIEKEIEEDRKAYLLWKSCIK